MNYERSVCYYGDREHYLRRSLGMMGYYDEDNYQDRMKSRDKYSRSDSKNTYTKGTERNQNHFQFHYTRQHFEQTKCPIGETYNDEKDLAATKSKLNRRINNNVTTPIVASPYPTTTKSESRMRQTKHRSHTSSHTSLGSWSKSRSSRASWSSSSSSKVRATSTNSERSQSLSKSRSPAASSANHNNVKDSRFDRSSSTIGNPSNTVSNFPSAVSTSVINSSSNKTITSTPTQRRSIDSLQNNSDNEEKKPLQICVRNLPVRSTDTSLKDGLYHEYKKYGKVTTVKLIGQGTDRYAVVHFEKPEDVDKALEVSKNKLFFGCKIKVTSLEGLDAEDNGFRPLEAELDEYHPKATRILFIKNFEKDITSTELQKHFDQFGEIIKIVMKKHIISGIPYAFIEYSDIASVVKSMRKLVEDGEYLGANHVKFGFGKSTPTNCVWLDGVTEKVTESFLRHHISNRFVGRIYVTIDRTKGHALVFFEHLECAQLAVSEMRGIILEGKKLQVDFASPECQTAFFEKLVMTGQLPSEDLSNQPVERDRQDKKSNSFEVVHNEDRYGREASVGFQSRSYSGHERHTSMDHGNQQTGFPGKNQCQNFPQYDVYHYEFCERRHRYPQSLEIFCDEYP